MKHVRLPAYDALDLDRLTYTNGELVNDTTNAVIRYMDGETPGGYKIASEAYVQANAITQSNLDSALTVKLQPYAKTTDLAPYALTADVNNAIAAIPVYSLPAATTSVLGGVKVDGVSITIDGNGVISGANQYVLPTASTTIKGGVKVDGVSITIDGNGVISGANQYVLPTASTTVKGGVIIPAVATSGLNNSAGSVTLAQATTTQLGGVKVDGTTITINPTTGVISGSNQYVLPTATTSVLGGVTIPATANSGLTNTAGAIRLATASTNQLGGIKVDGVTITINGSGVISANITGAIIFQGGWNAALNSPTLNNSSGAYNVNGYEFVTTVAGTVNFGAGNVTFAVGDNVIYDGTKWVKVPIGSSAGQTNSLLTIDNSGTGAASGTTFNGSSPITISYNTLGASPLAGSSSITTLGTITSGTWNGSVIGADYGGTGVANSFTLTITGANRTLDQNVNVNSAPIFVGTNFSGTAASLTVGNASAATTATTATNLAGGAAQRIPYQTAADTTSFVGVPTDNTYLKYTTAGGIQWTTVATATSATTATNLAGGAANRIHYQTAADTSGFIVAPTVTNTYLRWDGTNFVFSAVSGATGGTVTSVGGTGTVSGITLSGTVTSNGNLTLGGALSLVSPPAIGSTTPNTGQFTILTVNSASTSAVTLSPTGTGTVTINPTTAGTINNMSIGATTANTGRFTTVTSTIATGTAPFTVASTTNVANLNASSLNGATFASPGQIGSVTASTGRFTTIESTVTTGTAPFTVASTTNVVNLNASSLNGATFASPGSIGSSVAGSGAFTTVTATTSIKASGSGGIGYNTGVAAGGTVTQLVSRTTGVTLNKITGSITLVSAAGDNTQWLSFTVTNSTVASTDVVVVTGDTATNRYIANVSNVATGSFEITYFSFGTAIDQPKFNFAVIKGSAN